MTKLNKTTNRVFRELLLIFLGICSAAIGLKGFLLPNGFFDGGAMGISLLLNNFVKIELSVLIVAVNIPFVFLGIRQVSWTFAIKSAVAIFGLALAVHIIDFPTVTQDKLLISVFGGFFLGLGSDCQCEAVQSSTALRWWLFS
jgi:uncharacterized membrane-anchored protein YitT (DUF2179 family)